MTTNDKAAATAALIRSYYDRFSTRDIGSFLDLLADHVTHEISQGGTEIGKPAFRFAQARNDRRALGIRGFCTEGACPHSQSVRAKNASGKSACYDQARQQGTPRVIPKNPRARTGIDVQSGAPGQGASGTCSRPVISFSPNMMFIFWMSWREASWPVLPTPGVSRSVLEGTSQAGSAVDMRLVD